MGQSSALTDKPFLGLVNLLAVMAVALFLSAGTWRYRLGWIFLLEFFACALAVTISLIRTTPRSSSDVSPPDRPPRPNAPEGHPGRRWLGLPFRGPPRDEPSTPASLAAPINPPSGPTDFTWRP